MKDELERMKSRLSKKILKFENNSKEKDDEAEKTKVPEKELKQDENFVLTDAKLKEELEKLKKELEEEKTKNKNNDKKDENLEKELKEVKGALEKLEEEKKEFEKENEIKKEQELKKKEEIKKKKQEEEFGPLGIGIYDRRSIIKGLRKKQQIEESETLEKAFNPPVEILSVRYKKLLVELLYALLFTLVIGSFHLLMFKEIEFPKIVSQVVIIVLNLIGLFFFEKSYRKNRNIDLKLFIRGIEFIFVSSFLMYFTDKRFISSKLVTLILPIISVALIFYYIFKVIIIEKVERNKYIRSLSDVDNMIDESTKDEEIGMLYRKNVNNKKLTYLLKVMENRNKKEIKKEQKQKIELDVSNPYKKEKRSKKEQENFNKWKAKVKS